MKDLQAPVLLFPTHYLGNLVLGLPWVLQVLRKYPDALLVLDGQFQDLANLVLPSDTRVLLYPRQYIGKGQPLRTRFTHYRRFLKGLRNSGSDTILDLEGERFTGVLARLSGCSRRVGPYEKRAERFYTDILDLDYENHRFNAFRDIVADYVEVDSASNHLPYQLGEKLEESLLSKLSLSNGEKPLVAIHPGASVPYKLWSQDYFVELVKLLHASGMRVAWVGAGNSDCEIITAIRRKLEVETINLCNKLSVVELVAFYKHCKFFVGGDSGPMHLAASTGIPVFALFGPSNEAIWAPLGDNSTLLRGTESCGSKCNAWDCEYSYRCLQSLHPAAIMDAIDRADIDGIEQAESDDDEPAMNIAQQNVAMYEKIPVSAYIITLNEAENIGACLDRLVEFDEVILVDSGSTDGTVEIAQHYENVKASFNEWSGFSAQKTHALSLCSNEWVLNVDADEIITDGYLDAIKQTIVEDKVDALESNRTLFRWGVQPRRFIRKERLIRFFRKSAGHYEPKRVHECISISGNIGTTEATIDHFENLTYTQRVDKANKYSEAKAQDKFEKRGSVSVVTLVLIFPVTFIQVYFFKGFFLDGIDGLLSSMNTAFYTFMKYAKLWELNRGRKKR